MKATSRTGCIIGMAMAVCLGLCFSAAGESEKPKLDTPPLLPDIGVKVPLPPELQQLQAEPPPLPPELQQLEQMMKQKVEPPSLPQEEGAPPEIEKPAAAETKIMTDPASMPTDDITLFSHVFHVKKAGFNCTDCHNSIFQPTAGSAKAKGDFNMASFGQGKYCGTCHDGSTAFAVTDQASCIRCHGTDMKPSEDSSSSPNETDKGR